MWVGSKEIESEPAQHREIFGRGVFSSAIGVFGKTTSKIECIWFSMDQWETTTSSSLLGDTYVERMKYRIKGLSAGYPWAAAKT